MEDQSFLRMNLKMTYKWMWPWSRDPISKLWNPLITGKTSKVYYRYINYNKTANIKDKNLKVYNDVRVRSTVHISHN